MTLFRVEGRVQGWEGHRGKESRVAGNSAPQAPGKTTPGHGGL